MNMPVKGEELPTAMINGSSHSGQFAFRAVRIPGSSHSGHKRKASCPPKRPKTYWQTAIRSSANALSTCEQRLRNLRSPSKKETCLTYEAFQEVRNKHSRTG